MAVQIDTGVVTTTQHLLFEVLKLAKQGHRVQFFCDPGVGPAVVQRLRVALSRSRKRNAAKGKKLEEFTLHHSIHPHTTLEGKRHDAVVMWTVKTHHHIQRELLDDLLERGDSTDE